MSTIEAKIIEKISIPEYVRKYINSTIDLNDTPKICCPFHKELTPSFTYSESLGKWRCWGSCKHGGDVIEMHKFKFKMATREDAIVSLARLLGLSAKDMEFSFEPPELKISYELIEYKKAYNLAITKAKTIEAYKELDLIMSESKDITERTKDLQSFCKSY